MKTILTDYLTKIFPYDELGNDCLDYSSIFKNEHFYFQIAIREDMDNRKNYIDIKPVSGLEINTYSVELVPSDFPAYANNHDDNYITTKAGLFPDVLRPLSCRELIKTPANQWRSVWVEVIPQANYAEGEKTIDISIFHEDGTLVSQKQVSIVVLDGSLPEQELKYTRWFHCDGIMNSHNVEFDSDGFWRITEKYVKMMADHGSNMILTPLLTPSLDIAIGGERMDCQLVKITVDKLGYRFDFSRFIKWVLMCRRCGIKYFEISHLFTQWGAKYAPKVMATVGDEYKKIFGFDNLAVSTEYTDFLDALLPEFIAVCREIGIEKYIYLHISDEPVIEDMDQYRVAKDIIYKHIKDYPIIDALSELDFYNTGLIEIPIVATDHIEPFIEAGVSDLWCYYCCVQCVDVSNIFMSMPSARTSILSYQLFKYYIKGFLQWAYNFYNTQYSIEAIDPYKITDAGGAFPSGDSFVVYPRGDGPIPSLRLKVFSKCLDDLRRMQMLATLTSKEYVMDMIEGGGIEPIIFKSYPAENSYILGIREKLNLAIAQHS